MNTESTPFVSLTDAAREKLIEIIDAQNLRGRGALRVAITGRTGAGFNYSMALEEDPEVADDDHVQTEGDYSVLADELSFRRLKGATIDFVGQLTGGGFRVDNPNSGWDDPIAQAVQRLIDTQVNPGVASHGGFVELIDVKDDLVFVRLGGGCQGCGMVDVTLRQGIEVLIKEEIPSIQGVIDTTDHAGGRNPYYQPAKGDPEPASPHFQPSKG